MFRLEIDQDVARLTLDRPDARNAIPASGWEALAAKVDEAGSARILVLAGAGGAFCAGADLGDFAAMAGDDDTCAAFRTSMRAALDAVRALPIPTIAWIDGPCYGAGVALAMACDLRIAMPSARFAITPAKIGISYPQEDVHRLVALVGTGQAARLLFTAQPIDAAEAAWIGLVDLLGGKGVIEAILANDGDSLKVLKRAIALAADGVRSDARQDARFDALIAGEALAARLEARRRT